MNQLLVFSKLTEYALKEEEIGMNVSQVSFCGKSNYSSYDANRPNTERIRDDLRKGTGFDSYVSTSQGTSRTSKGHNKKAHNPYKTACLIAAFLKLASMVAGGVTEPQDTTDVNAKAGESVDKYAIVYDIPADVIMDYNNLSNPIFGTNTTISIPSMFDHVGEKIDELQEDLYKRGTDFAEAAEITEQIEELQDVQQMQSEIATMYTDGDFVYFLITLPTDETATETQRQFDGYINVEKFKDIFGIKDGVIRKYNDVEYSWGSDEYGGYKDYTGNILRNGETVKVPVSAVKVSLIEQLKD